MNVCRNVVFSMLAVSCLIVITGCEPHWEPVKLLVKDATITEKLRMYSPETEEATVQSWHRLNDRTSWKWSLKKGN